MKVILGVKSFRWLLVLVLGTGLFLGGYFFSNSSTSSRPTEQTFNQKKSYYISFDDYYYEIPKQKTADDRLIPGGQFLYNTGVIIRADSFDNLFNDGAIAIQALIPLNGDVQAFERYVNGSVKPSAESAFKGTADVIFDSRKNDSSRTAEVVSKKDGAVIRRQYIVNLPHSVAIITKDDNEESRKIGESIGQASTRFSDYETVKLQVLAQSFMLSNRMFDDMYRLAHEDLQGATSVDAINRLADKSKEIFSLEAKISGVTINKDEMTASIFYLDKSKSSNNKAGVLGFRKVNKEWKLITIQLPNGTITGAPQESTK